MGRHSVGEPDKTGVRPDGAGQPWRTAPPRNQQPMPPCTRCGAPLAAHMDDKCPQAETATDRITAQQSATGRPTLPSAVKNNKKRLRVILAFAGVAIVVALGVSIYAIKASTAKTNTASVCIRWDSSADEQVFDENESYGWCNKTNLMVPPQDGGPFSVDSAQPTHGSQVCSESGGAPGFKGVDIIYEGMTGGSTEAENMCATMQSDANQDPSLTYDQTLAPVDSTSTKPATPIEIVTTPTPAITTTEPAPTVDPADFNGWYKESYNQTATDYRDGQTPAIYHESDSKFCMSTIEPSLNQGEVPASLEGTSRDPFYAGCMAALSAQQ
jgi:hypothetical protein